MTDQAELSLFEPHDERPKSPVLGVLSLPNFSSSPAQALTIGTRSDVSEVPRNGTSRGKLRKAHKKIIELREKLVGRRLRLKEKRNELREERTHASDLDAQFIRAISQPWELGQRLDNEALSRLYHEVQAARDALGPLEDDYNQDEDEVDAAEFQLNDEEKRFYSLYSANGSASGISSDQDSVPSSFSSLNSRKGVALEDTKPGRSILDEYRSRVGDANIVKERLESLRLEREQYLDEERLRDRVELALYPPNRVFLDNFDYNYTQLKQELDHIVVDAQRLRKEALAEVADVEKLFSPSLARPRESQLRYNVPSALYSECKSDSAVRGLLVDFASTRARINRWILDTLKDSSMERANHKAILKGLSHQWLDDQAWARLVFEYWRKDKAAINQVEDANDENVTSGAAFEQKDLTFWNPGERRSHYEQSRSDDRQLYADGNPLLAPPVNLTAHVGAVPLRDTELSASDLYSNFTVSRSL